MKFLLTALAFAGSAFAASAAALAGGAWASCPKGFNAVSAGSAQPGDIEAVTNCGQQFFLKGGNVKPDATAFAQRAAEHNVFLLSRGFYVNECNPEDVARLAGTYGGNYARLRKLKLKDTRDHGNLFRLNANAVPTA